jgi:PQQ-like domain
MTTQAISWMRRRAGRYAGRVARCSDWRGRSRVLMAAAAGMVLAAGVFASPAAASASTPGITLKPTSGPPTTKVSVTGAGFGTSETVTVDFSTTQVATATTSSTGTFSAAFTVPKTATPASYPVTATGQSSHLSATANFLVRTNWPQLRFSATGTGVNPYENVISTSNVATLIKAWQSSINGAYLSNSPPAAYNGVLYTGSGLAGTALDAFNPSNGALKWQGVTLAPGANGAGGTPAVVNNMAYIASADGNLYAYSTNTTSCSGTPKTCKPRWTGSLTGISVGSPVVSGGMVYVTAGYQLDAFSATGCGTAVCQPLWVSAIGQAPGEVTGGSTPAVSGGVVYAGGSGGLYAYSTNYSACTGTPKTCQPLWRGFTTGMVSVGDTAVAVARGWAYVSAENGVFAFSTGGCGTATCNPAHVYIDASSWYGFTSPAVAGGIVYANADNPYAGDTLFAFSTTLAKAWTAPLPDGYGGTVADVAIADGVAYTGNTGDVAAYSASGTTNCSGTPKVCTPLWTLAGPNAAYGRWDTPIVVNGMLYATEWNGTPFSAYKLP